MCKYICILCVHFGFALKLDFIKVSLFLVHLFSYLFFLNDAILLKYFPVYKDILAKLSSSCVSLVVYPFIYIYIYTSIFLYMFHKIHFEVRCRGDHLENQTEKDTEWSIMALLKAI